MPPAVLSSPVSQTTFDPPIWPFSSSFRHTPPAVMMHPTPSVSTLEPVLVAVRRSAAAATSASVRCSMVTHSRATLRTTLRNKRCRSPIDWINHRPAAARLIPEECAILSLPLGGRLRFAVAYGQQALARRLRRLPAGSGASGHPAGRSRPEATARHQWSQVDTTSRWGQTSVICRFANATRTSVVGRSTAATNSSLSEQGRPSLSGD